MRDPFGRLGTAARLATAAALCVLPLGLGWSLTGFLLLPGYVVPGTCSYAEEGSFCTEDSYVPRTFDPGHTLHGSQTPARLFLVAAAVALVVVAGRVRTASTRRVARLATGALAVAAVLAVADRAALPAACIAVALALSASPAWGRAVLAPGRRAG